MQCSAGFKFHITIAILALAVLVSGCAGEPTPVPPDYAAVSGAPNTPIPLSTGTPRATSTLQTTATVPPSKPTLSAPATASQTAPSTLSDPVLLAAGDIATCGMTSAEATARLLDDLPGTVATIGDNAYPEGAPSDFTNCYAPTWGRLKARTRPSPGNHEYVTKGAAGYFGYFGAAAGPAGTGYYSYDLGAWHILSLNSEFPVGTSSPQVQWLRADLAAHQTQCTLAYWHQPRFSSGPHGSNKAYQVLWQVLYENGAEVVLNGHDHDYERFAPEKPDGTADPARGIREFVVGTGGATLYPFITRAGNSEVRNNTTWGILKLTLHAAGYDWKFIPVAGRTFTDSGSSDCH